MDQKNKLKEAQKANKGITLIALVITIIVLLILAAVSISTLTGENGILTKAKDAKDLTKIAEEKEQIRLAYSSVITSKMEKEKKTPVTADELGVELKKLNRDVATEEKNQLIEVVFTKTGNIYKVDGSNGKIQENIESNPPSEDQAIPGQEVTGNNKKYISGNDTAIIPVGFTIVPGCENISEGLVISDNPNDTEEGVDESQHVAEGNQFVWIPVTESTYVKNTRYDNIEVSSTVYTDNDYLPDMIQQTIQEDIDGAVATDTKTKEEIIGEINEQAERQAVVSKGGFYIARYEARQGVNSKVESKKNVIIWDRIEQKTAKEKAKTFINNTHVKSALISGIQWDATMAFISSQPRTDGNGKTYDVTIPLTETGYTRHTGKPAYSGVNKADKVCNIYDLEGNSYEYVAEKNTSNANNSYVVRGR